MTYRACKIALCDGAYLVAKVDDRRHVVGDYLAPTLTGAVTVPLLFAVPWVYGRESKEILFLVLALALALVLAFIVIGVATTRTGELGDRISDDKQLNASDGDMGWLDDYQLSRTGSDYATRANAYLDHLFSGGERDHLVESHLAEWLAVEVEQSGDEAFDRIISPQTLSALDDLGQVLPAGSDRAQSDSARKPSIG